MSVYICIPLVAIENYAMQMYLMKFKPRVLKHRDGTIKKVSLPCLSCFSSVHSSDEEKENNGDGTSLYVSVGDSRSAQRDGRFHAGAGGRPATEAY